MSLPRTPIRSIMICLASLLLFTSAYAQPAQDFTGLMNHGKAYLENRNSAKAIEIYTAAVAIRPTSAPALRNLARAQLLARKPMDALRSLQLAREAQPSSPGTAYLSGLAHIAQSNFGDAIPQFEEAVRLDPNQPALRFQLAGAYQANQQHDKAAEQLRETVRLDPLHASAHYKLQSYARKAKDREGFQRHMREFMRLRKLFGDGSRSTQALAICLYTRPEPPALDLKQRAPARNGSALQVRFVDVTREVFDNEGDGRATVVTFLQMNAEGHPTLFVADAEGRSALMTMTSGVFKRMPLDLPVAKPAAFTACLAGDFHNDVPKGDKYEAKIHARNDVLLVGPGGVRLLEQAQDGSFADVTVHAGLGDLTGRRACWVDYEHDGDLDLWIARDTGPDLWQNNGDGRFERVTKPVGIDATAAVVDVTASDLDADVVVDLIAATDTKGTFIFENQRAGLFRSMPEPPGPWPAARRILLDDIDNDALPDALLVSIDHAIVRSGRTGKTSRLDWTGLHASAAALIDYDNDGWLDVLIAGSRDGGAAGALRLFANRGTDGWTDVSESVGLISIGVPSTVRDVLAVDVDADGDTDVILITENNELRIIRNDGGHANGQLRLNLSTLKTNPSAIGTHIELRAGDFWVTRTATGMPITIGLAGHKRLDSVQTLWTNGVVDNQLDVNVASGSIAIVEKNVATGSCPFLYVWDGERFRFVTDLLGNAPLGLPLRRDFLLPADSDEFVWIGDAHSLSPVDGEYLVEVTSEFQEVLYLDHARLVAVDHAPGMELHPTDKIMPPPFPRSELIALTRPRIPISAKGDDGIDRTQALQHIDGDFAPTGPLLPPPYRGACQPMALTLDFGALDARRPLVLALTGWLQYGQASTNIAVSQNKSLTIIPPSLEVETSDGTWTAVDVIVGMPAGKTKTILCDLRGKLPPDAQRLRLINTFEIRWDRIALMEWVSMVSPHEAGSSRSDSNEPDASVYHELLPAAADLYYRGFSEIKSRAPGHPTTPDYDVVLNRPAWHNTLQGWCTRYGDVLELLTKRDDRLVLVNGGDAVTLRFDAEALPPIPDGMTRTFFFYSVGWDKDADPNVVDGDKVLPMPIADPPVSDDEDTPLDDWRLEYNTRWVPFDKFADRP